MHGRSSEKVFRNVRDLSQRFNVDWTRFGGDLKSPAIARIAPTDSPFDESGHWQLGGRGSVTSGRWQAERYVHEPGITRVRSR